MDLPHVPKTGEELTAKWGGKVARALRAMQLGRSESIAAKVTPNGTILEVRRRDGGRATTAVTAFEITPVSGEAKITVSPGDVENIIPTIFVPSVGAVFLSATPPPQLDVVTGPVFVECTMDAAGTFTAAEVKNAAALPANTPTLRYRQLGTVAVVDGAAVRTAQTVTTSISHKLCNGQSTWGRA